MTVVIAQVEYVDYHVHIPIQTHRHVTVEKRMQRTLWGNGNNCCLLAFLGNISGDHKVQQGQRVCGGKFQQKEVVLVIVAYVSCKGKRRFQELSEQKFARSAQYFNLPN